MSIKIYSAFTIGVDARILEIEIDVKTSPNKQTHFKGVGLPYTGLGDMRQRITTVLANMGIITTPIDVVVNVFPNIKQGDISILDMPILVGILLGLGKISHNASLKKSLLLGEIGLDGSFRSIKGGMVIADSASKNKYVQLIVPDVNKDECAAIATLKVIGVSSLQSLIDHLNNKNIILPTVFVSSLKTTTDYDFDYSDIKGQHFAKRAFQIAAAGRHNIILMGPPGSGKTMLAQRLITIMPEMTFNQQIEVSKVFSVAGLLTDGQLINNRPFRAPHHGISYVGLIGGGPNAKPGEISLSHQGVLFLDELTEFSMKALDMLRQPLESKKINVTRAQYSVDFPADCLFVGAFNPCPCGYYNDSKRTCSCSTHDIKRYLTRISGPLLDRMDLQIVVPSVEIADLMTQTKDPVSSDYLRNDIAKAIKRQKNGWNNDIKAADINELCKMTPQAQQLINKAFDRFKLTVRSYHKILRVSKTIADLEEVDLIEEHHIKEALTYRSIDSIIHNYQN